jgi:AAHS family 4-hydroxybenzoate transporter-like MFS transporter
VGWALGIGRIGSIVGPILGGIMLSLHLPLTTVFMVGAIPSLVGSGAIFLMGRTPNSVNAKSAMGVAAS